MLPYGEARWRFYTWRQSVFVPGSLAEALTDIGNPQLPTAAGGCNIDSQCAPEGVVSAEDLARFLGGRSSRHRRRYVCSCVRTMLHGPQSLVSLDPGDLSSCCQSVAPGTPMTKDGEGSSMLTSMLALSAPSHPTISRGRPASIDCNVRQCEHTKTKITTNVPRQESASTEAIESILGFWVSQVFSGPSPFPWTVVCHHDGIPCTGTHGCNSSPAFRLQSLWVAS